MYVCMCVLSIMHGLDRNNTGVFGCCLHRRAALMSSPHTCTHTDTHTTGGGYVLRPDITGSFDQRQDSCKHNYPDGPGLAVIHSDEDMERARKAVAEALSANGPQPLVAVVNNAGVLLKDAVF